MLPHKIGHSVQSFWITVEPRGIPTWRPEDSACAGIVPAAAANRMALPRDSKFVAVMYAGAHSLTRRRAGLGFACVAAIFLPTLAAQQSAQPSPRRRGDLSRLRTSQQDFPLYSCPRQVLGL